MRAKLPGANTLTPEQLTKAIGDKFRSSAPLTSAEAATQILNGVRAGSSRILVGEDAAIMDLLARLCPSLLHQDWFMALVLGPWAMSSSHLGAVLRRTFGNALAPAGRLAYPSTIAGLAYALRWCVHYALTGGGRTSRL